MKTANTFYWTFIDTLIYNIATLAAIVVGVSQFLIRAWNENNCSAKVRQFLIQTLRLINASTALIYENLNHEVPAEPAPVTVRKVAQRRTKRS
jgi:hypothetical protein